MSEALVKQPVGRPPTRSLKQAGLDVNEKQLRYAAWVSVPERFRVPASITEFAELLGVRRETLWRWGLNPKVQSAIRFLILKNAGDPARMANVFDVLYEMIMDSSASDKSRLAAIHEFIEAVGTKYKYADPELLKVKEIDEIVVEDLSDEELWDLMAQRGGAYGEMSNVPVQFDSRLRDGSLELPGSDEEALLVSEDPDDVSDA